MIDRFKYFFYFTLFLLGYYFFFTGYQNINLQIENSVFIDEEVSKKLILNKEQANTLLETDTQNNIIVKDELTYQKVKKLLKSKTKSNFFKYFKKIYSIERLFF